MVTSRFRMGALLIVVSAAACQPEPSFELILRGGTVVDGTGTPAFVADIGVAEGRIAAIGADLPASSDTEVMDVGGMTVTPGFWDNHAHLVTLEDHPDAENFIRQGITTILAPLHSQDQPFPLDDYMNRVSPAPNVGLFAGHTWIRKRVLGLEDRAPTSTELSHMVALVDSTMQQGALGLSTGLEYVPAIFSQTDEIVAMAEVAARHGGVYVTHMRDEGVRVQESVEESLEVGRRAGIPVQINHLKITGSAHWGSASQILAVLDSARADGIDVVHDIYPYTAFSTYSDLLFPAWALADGPDAFADRMRQPQTRARVVEEMRAIYGQQTGSGPGSVQFRNFDSHPDLEGRTLADYLTDRGRALTLDETIDALIELQLEGGFIGVFHGMAEEDVATFVRHPLTRFETDGDLVRPGVGYPHPRSYGSFPRVLAKYVRDEGVITLEEAVHRMTSLTASWYGHSDRGTLTEGAIADIVVLRIEDVQDRAEYTDPHHYSDGIIDVLVAGTPVLRDGEMTGARPGRFLDRRTGR